jgi:hypothetical protein
VVEFDQSSDLPVELAEYCECVIACARMLHDLFVRQVIRFDAIGFDMAPHAHVDPILRGQLAAVYEEMMWLAKRPDVTPSMVRGWYTHVVAGRFKRRIRRFTGKVSRAAASSGFPTLRLEHYKRIQTSLTSLVERHLKLKKPNPNEFIRLVLECERVHIVTFDENYAAMRADGNYGKAGIELISWNSLPNAHRRALWTKMLRGNVANANRYEPTGVEPT